MSDVTFGNIDSYDVREIINLLGGIDKHSTNDSLEVLLTASNRQATVIASIITYMNKGDIMSDQSVNEMMEMISEM